MKKLLFALAFLASASAQAKDCRPIVCTLSQIDEAKTLLTKLSLTQSRSDDDKCAIFEGGNEVTLANGTDKVILVAAEEQGMLMLQLDTGLIEGQSLIGSASTEVTRRQLALDPVKLELAYYRTDGNQAGLLELVCQRSTSRHK
ncbi:MAG: hypothetical protein AB7K68_11955 [Bacteriovoracia bacterium]